MSAAQWRELGFDERAAMLREQSGCGNPQAQAISGLVAHLDGEPVGRCAVQPRTDYPRLPTGPIPWSGGEEPEDDAGVWAVTCFVTRVRAVMRIGFDG